MAAAAASSSPSQGRYDVFLSFRGEDTRNNFTAHLCEELHTKGINTFIDEEKLERGQAVSAALVSAIENSMFSIIVLSENYASSRWCLEELVKIIQCMKNSGHRVLPIFYNVDPSDVRNHMGKFGEALAKHEENSKEGMERVQIWKDALTQVTNFSGWDSRNKNESLLIKQIVKDILNKLLSTSSSDIENLVGIDARIQEMKTLLCLASDDVRMVGIWGMGGIGKTTLVRAVYSRISYQFEGCSFLENVAEDLKKKGLIGLQEKLLSHLLEEENLNMKELTSIKARLHSKKNLVHLSMHYSHINRLWKGIKVLEKLKVVDLSHSKSLIETPDFSRVPNLERLVLEGCISLHKVHPSLGVLNKLNFLSLKNCEKLKSLPSSMCDLKSLETFILSGCSRLEDFPENFGNLEMLKELHADEDPIYLMVVAKKKFKFYWFHIASFVRFIFFNKAKPRGLSSLEGLLLEKCKRLQILPELPSSIYSLIAQDCISLENASNQVLKSLFPTAKSPKKTFKCNSGAHLIYVMVYGSRIPDWIRYQSSGCEVEADLPPNCYIANRISIRCDKEGVGLDHVWLLYIKLPLFSNWHNGTPINWHEVTHISVSFGTQVMGWYPPIKRCGFDLVYSNDQDVNPPVIQFSSISSPPLPNKSTVVLKEIHKEEEPSGSGWSNVDGSESDSSDYHTADEEEPTTAKETDRSEDHSESEMRPQKRLKCRHYEGIP
ncbi:TMV resistance protein N [Vitis vinifera]|uniref:ADP-ribosyl cyclase/cyclic ADP-ribose hydrolase n=3 Tax=Vitis vinifera TaxID=29760 RepID=A0A438C8X5_VITVI|nr:TMV resistance protein N [Vitis vinifera]